MPVTYVMAGLESSDITFWWEFDSDVINVATCDYDLRYGEAQFKRDALIECLGTVLEDLKGTQ